MPQLPSLPEKATLLDVFKRFPASSRPLLLYHEVLMRGPSPFTEGERELIAAVVSRRNRCGYCEGVHAATARALGEAPARVAAVLGDPLGARESAELRPVLAYVEKLTQDAASVSEADAEAVLAAGWPEQALFDAVAICALYNLMNRLVNGLGIEADAAYFEAAAERLSTGGYAAMAEALPQA
ncbi:MAG: peroxidase-related enzyme [Kiloniellales bacterium]|nr:peroxidase-related enzyme [Kiloniellales bacterium]